MTSLLTYQKSNHPAYSNFNSFLYLSHIRSLYDQIFRLKHIHPSRSLPSHYSIISLKGFIVSLTYKIMHASTTLFLVAFVGSAVGNPISTSWASNSTTSSSSLTSSSSSTPTSMINTPLGTGHTTLPQPSKTIDANASTSTPPPTQSTNPPQAGGSWLTTIYPTTVVSTSTKFVPCSTPVAASAGTTYYSTWLTPTLIPTSYVSTCTESYTTVTPTTTPVAPVLPATTPTGETCPTAKTVTITQVITAGSSLPTTPPADCKSCYEVHTLTLTNGQTSVITLTHTQSTNKPTTIAEPTGTGSTPTGTGSTPTGTGSSPQGTGNVKWRRANVTPKAL